MKRLLSAALILWTTNAAAFEAHVALFLGGEQLPTTLECANAIENGNLVASTFIDGYRPVSLMAYKGFIYKIKIEDNVVKCLPKQRYK